MPSILEEFAHGNVAENLLRGYKLGVLMTAEAFVTGGDLIDG